MVRLIDQLRSFSYLGTIVNENNTLEEEIKELQKRTKHFTRKKLFLQANWCQENLN
jgi:hypothetical protein